LYMVHRHTQEWNASNTLLLDARFISSGQPSSELIATNYSVVEFAKTQTGAFRNVVPGSRAYVTGRLERFDVGQMVPTFSMVLLYYFYTLQVDIAKTYKRHKTLESAGLDMVVKGSKFPIRAEYIPDGLLLDIRSTYMIVYISKEPHYRLPATSWWGICRKDQYSTHDRGFRKWVVFGYVSHEPSDVQVFDPNPIGNTVNTFVEFPLNDVQLDDTLHVFVVYTEDNEELHSQVFHPRIYNDFMSVFQWDRPVETTGLEHIRSVYKSSTEHEVIIILGTCTSIDISGIGVILTISKDSGWETTSTTGLYILPGTITGKTLTFSLFGEPGYYTLAMKDRNLNNISTQDIFLGRNHRSMLQ
jgi:hypothetical protein